MKQCCRDTLVMFVEYYNDIGYIELHGDITIDSEIENFIKDNPQIEVKSCKGCWWSKGPGDVCDNPDFEAAEDVRKAIEEGRKCWTSHEFVRGVR